MPAASKGLEFVLKHSEFGRSMLAGRALVDATAAAALAGRDATVLVGIVNPAENRPGGGLLGGYALLAISGSDIRVLASGPNDEVNAQVMQDPRKRILQRQHGITAATWFDATLSPDFRETAWVWSQLAQERWGFPPDVVLAVDPKVLAAATGNDRLVEWLSLRQYDVGARQRSAADRKLIARALRNVNPIRLFQAFHYGLTTGRLRITTADESAQTVIESASPASRLPTGLGLYEVNSAGNKMDQFLNINTAANWFECTTEKSVGIVTTSVVLDVAKDAKLSNYVNRRTDFGVTTGIGNATSVTFALLGTPKSKLVSLLDLPDGVFTLDTRKVSSRPYVPVRVELKPGQTKTVSWHVEIPHGEASSLWVAPTFENDALWLPGC